MREMLANIIVIALSGCLLWHFYLLVTHGAIYIYETNPLISSIEIMMFCVFIGFAIANIMKLLRSS